MATNSNSNSEPRPDRVLECPFCESKVKEETKKDLAILTRLRLSIPVKCTMSSNGCTWEGDVSQFWDHLSVCNYFPRPCPHNCDPNVFMPKEILKSHLQDKCPMKSIPCEYKWAGCTAVFNRMEMAVHMKESALAHNELLAKVAKTYKSQVHLLQAEINQMKESPKPKPQITAVPTVQSESPPAIKKRKVTFSQSADIIDNTHAVEESKVVMTTPNGTEESVTARIMPPNKEKPRDNVEFMLSPIVGYASNMEKMAKQCPPLTCRYIKPDWRTLMIKCQSCHTWYHSMCAHVVNNKAREMTEYICSTCKK